MRFLAPFFAAALALLPASGAAGDDPVFHELGRQQGEIEQAVREAEGLQTEASRAQDLERLDCLAPRTMYLKGLALAGRTAVDEYAVASLADDDDERAASVQKVGRAWAAMPAYLDEARVCGTQSEIALDDRCTERESRVGVACTSWRVTTPRRNEPFEFGKVDGGTTAPSPARTRGLVR